MTPELNDFHDGEQACKKGLDEDVTRSSHYHSGYAFQHELEQRYTAISERTA